MKVEHWARRSVLVLSVVALLAVVVTTASGASKASFVFCSDVTYPPEEFFPEGSSKPAGSDIDIGAEVARRLGRKVEFANTGFDGIIAALLGKKCDAVISGMNVTPEREKQVAFVRYLAVGQSIMVRAGNPRGFATLSDLSGHAVSVEVGTTNKANLDRESRQLKAAGKKSIDVVAFPKDTDAANALKTGKVDAYFGDSPVVAYYIARDPKSFGFAGAPIDPIAVGIALRKQDTTLRRNVQRAVDGMYADGTMKRILAKWKMSAFALKGT
jgi:polar amino acid transport system substrate-binding protein